MIQINHTHKLLFLLLPAILIFGAGCKSGPIIVKVKGNLLIKGKPLTSTPGTIVTLQFIPKEGGNTFSGKVLPGEGSYEAEMPAGVYNVMFLTHDMKSGKPIPKLKNLKANLDIQSNQSLDLETAP
jgi:hypothetical protein